MHTDRSLRVILLCGTVAIVSAALGGLVYLNKPMPPDGEPVLGSPQLIMFETENCGWCEQFRRKIAKEYQTSEYAGQAPLRFISVDEGPPPKRYRLNSFSRSPMLVIFDQYGRELDRLESDPGTNANVETLVRRSLRRIAKT